VSRRLTGPTRHVAIAIAGVLAPVWLPFLLAYVLGTYAVHAWERRR
jgi:hypothetical protein